MVTRPTFKKKKNEKKINIFIITVFNYQRPVLKRLSDSSRDTDGRKNLYKTMKKYFKYNLMVYVTA